MPHAHRTPASRQRLLPWLAMFIVLVLLSARLVAQTTEDEQPAVPNEAAQELTTAALQARQTTVQNNASLDPTLKQRLLDLYGKTLERLKNIEDAKTRNDRFTVQAREVPQSLASLQTELAGPTLELPLDFPAEASLTQGQSQRTTIEAELQKAQLALKTWQDEPKRRSDRRVEIPKQLELLKSQLEEVGVQLDVKPAADDPLELVQATRLALEARKLELNSELAAQQAELRFYEAASELLPLRRDLAARKVAQWDSLLKRLQTEINERRRKEVEKEAMESRRIAAQAHPALKAIADRNAELARLREKLASRIEAAAIERDQLDERVTRLTSQFEKISKRIVAGQYNQSIGLLLRKQREELPVISEEQRKLQQRETLMTATSLEVIDYEDARNDLATPETRLDEILQGLPPSVDPEEQLFLRNDVRDMLVTQRNYLDAIIVDTNSYFDRLAEQDAKHHELIAKTGEYAAFCNERIFWIRSASGLNFASLTGNEQALSWLFQPEHGIAVVEALHAEVMKSPLTAVLVMLLWFGCLFIQRRLRRTSVALGHEAARSACRTYLPTLQTLFLTFALAVIWPLPLALLGVRLAGAVGSPEFVIALGKSCVILSAMFAGFNWLRQFTRAGGLGEAHFGWDVDGLRCLRHAATWVIVCGLPLTLVVLLCEFQSNEAAKSSLGRMAFLALNGFLLLPIHLTMRAKDGVFSSLYLSDPTAWWSRLRWVWTGLAWGAPLTLIGLAAAGYYYTATQLAGRCLMTFGLLVGLALVYGLLLRWSLIAYRNLGMQRLQQRRAAAAEAATPTAPQTANSSLEMKLADINQQTRKTLQLIVALGLIAGVGWIWADLVPALGALRRVVLWTLEAPPAIGTTTPILTPITLADLMLSLIILLFTIAFSRNIPSLLELTILKRLPFDAGARYATATVAKYTLTGAGTAAACGVLGFEWMQIQWLVAAVSVGLGFGLQEIFANFVSGLVLLFERPIRIGDIVSIGDIDGKVSNIRLRATTITDWDMRELIVPNKEFITQRLINWTLTTTVSRMSIEVGVAYGTDPNRVRELLLEVAAQHPLVLKSPPSHALLDQFADSALVFILRVHMPTRDVYLQLRHELMAAITNRFQAEGIVIAFPQRDLNVRFAEPLSHSAPDLISLPSNGTSRPAEGYGVPQQRAQ